MAAALIVLDRHQLVFSMEFFSLPSFLPSLGVTQIGSHKAGVSPSPPYGTCFKFCLETTSALSSFTLSARIELRLPSLGALSSFLFSKINTSSKAR